MEPASTAEFIRSTLADLRAAGLYRRLVEVGSAAGRTVEIDGRQVLLFASNNYLGLAADERVREAARRAIDRWGWGAGASRLISGHTEAHAALERDLADFKHAEAAIVLPTGYQANLAALSALAGRGDTLVMDRTNHASLYDGARLSGARLLRYAHGDAAAAARILRSAARSADPARGPSRDREVAGTSEGEAIVPASSRSRLGIDRTRTGRRLLVTDTVFSMDGDLAPLADLAAACATEGAALVVDEAHATGVLGPGGAGLAEALGLDGAITASVGTLSKALGGIGGFVAASREVCDLVVNRARPFIYTTALPAAACEAARAALAIVRTEPERRRRLADLARKLRAKLREKEFDTDSGQVGPASGVSRRACSARVRTAECAANGGGAGPSTPHSALRIPHSEVPAGLRSRLGADIVTPIVPIIVGDAGRAMAMAARLMERGIFCPAIRPPTVPAGTSRLRISLTCEHTEEDLARLVEALVAARDAARTSDDPRAPRPRGG